MTREEIRLTLEAIAGEGAGSSSAQLAAVVLDQERRLIEVDLRLRALEERGGAVIPDPLRSNWWLGRCPRPCSCMFGPCEGGENGCGYEPAEWDAWEAEERAAKLGRSLPDARR